MNFEIFFEIYSRTSCHEILSASVITSYTSSVSSKAENLEINLMMKKFICNSKEHNCRRMIFRHISSEKQSQEKNVHLVGFGANPDDDKLGHTFSIPEFCRPWRRAPSPFQRITTCDNPYKAVGLVATHTNPHRYEQRNKQHTRKRCTISDDLDVGRVMSWTTDDEEEPFFCPFFHTWRIDEVFQLHRNEDSMHSPCIFYFPEFI